MDGTTRIASPCGRWFQSTTTSWQEGGKEEACSSNSLVEKNRSTLPGLIDNRPNATQHWKR